jgi:hypothetical protein
MSSDDLKFQASLLDPAPNSHPPEPSIYEQMHRYLYDYHFGHITFLELLDKWKEVLQMPTRDKQ